MTNNAVQRQSPQWYHSTSDLGSITQNQRYWLTMPQKLGVSLKKIRPGWYLHLCFSGYQSIACKDQMLLDNQHKTDLAYQRIVIHYDGDSPLVLGKAILPLTTYRQYQPIIDDIGQKSLGDVFLFKHQSIKRYPFFYTVTTPEEPGLYPWLDKTHLNGVKQVIYGRSSKFVIDHDYPLLINEFFLQDLEIPDNTHKC